MDLCKWQPRVPYSQNPSTKINVVLHIVQYHLAKPGRPPLHIAEPGSNALEPNPDFMAPGEGEPARTPGELFQDPKLGPDKVIIYLAFPRNNWTLEKVRS